MLYVVYLALYIVIGYGVFKVKRKLDNFYKNILKTKFQEAYRFNPIIKDEIEDYEYHGKKEELNVLVDDFYENNKVFAIIFGLITWLIWPISVLNSVAHKTVAYMEAKREIEKALGN